MQVDLIQIDPNEIKLLDVNARYMRHETFMRLVDNIKRDGKLTSVPFGWQVHDDDTQTPQTDDDGQPVYEVLSGNHRVKAAVAANLDQIDFMVTRDYLSPDHRRAIQLSHNSITGEDDPEILKTIYSDIHDVEMRMYSGLDDKALGMIASPEVMPLGEANLEFQTISMTFLPHEVESIDAVWTEAKKAVAGSKAVWLNRWADYDRALDAIEDASTAHGVRNTATAMQLILGVFERNLPDLTEAYLDGLGDPIEPGRRVPTASVLGDRHIPAKTASRLEKLIARLMSQKQIDSDSRWQVLDHLLDAYDAERHKD